MTKPLISYYDGFIFDMDGTLSRGDRALPGAIELLHQIQHLGKYVVLLTDNSTTTRAAISSRLKKWGISLPPRFIITSTYATAYTLARSRGSARVFLIGEDAFREELEVYGHVLVRPEEADVLVVGFAHYLSYNTLGEGLIALRRGALFVATDQAETWAAADAVLPGVGSIVGAFRGMGYEPNEIVGKPFGVAVDMAYALVKTCKQRTLLIGDTIQNDIASAEYLGVDSALVLTGVSSQEDVMESTLKPTYVIANLCGVFDPAGVNQSSRFMR